MSNRQPGADQLAAAIRAALAARRRQQRRDRWRRTPQITGIRWVPPGAGSRPRPRDG